MTGDATSSVINEDRNTTAAVRKFTGTAYDKMAALYEQLPTLIALKDEIDEFNSSWLGIKDTVPTTRNDGSALQDGDRYFHSVSKNTYVWSNGAWAGGVNIITTHEVIEISAGTHHSGADTVITLSNAYEPGANNLVIYLDSARQISRSVDVTEGSYTETNDTTITFPGYLVPPGTILYAITGEQLNTINPIISVETRRYVVETEGQTLVPLPDGMFYTPGSSNIDVHINGDLKYGGVDYTETSGTSITVVAPLSVNDEIIFKKGEIISTATSTSSNVTVLTTNLSDAFNANNSVLSIQDIVITRGSNTVGDGGGGVWAYDPTFSKAQANGYTVIDSEKTIAQQGTGTGSGCWIRQYEDEVKPYWYNLSARNATILNSTGIKPIDGDRAKILDFYANTGIGGGDFVWRSNVAANTHDGGIVISNQVAVPAGDSGWWDGSGFTGNGVWIRQYTGPVMAEWYGVKAGDGSFDNLEALNKAGATGKPVYLPAGAYQCTGTPSGTFYTMGTVTVLGGGGDLSAVKNLLV